MEFAIGVAAATGVGIFATVIGFDKERSFYPVVLIVIATLYLLFAVMAGSTESMVAEAFPALVFVAMATLPVEPLRECGCQWPGVAPA